MFTLQEIKAAHAKVKTGADFPRYIQEIKKLGLKTYEFSVADGTTNYYGDDGHHIKADAIYPTQIINLQPNTEALKQIIAIHQQGLTDFPTVCRQVAGAGVHHWIMDTQIMLCTYFDRSGNAMLAEPIPDGDY